MSIPTKPTLPRNINPGDRILTRDGGNITVDERYTDHDGTWITWSEGDGGYVHDENAKYHVIVD